MSLLVCRRRGSRGSTNLSGLMKVLGGQGNRAGGIGSISKQASVAPEGMTSDAAVAGVFSARYISP